MIKSFMLIALFGALLQSQVLHGQNPLIRHIYAADPSAHVWPSDTNTLWLYTTMDEPGTNHHYTMAGYRVFSTQDMVNWTDHGQVLSVDNVDWAVGWAWAPDAAYHDGVYYLVYCMREIETGMFRTGLATSDVPQGPFTDIGFIKGVEWGQDPSLFINDDGTPYLFWGLGGETYGVQLTNDFRSAIPETYVDLTSQLFEVFEGPWVHKYNEKYYLSYPGLPGGNWPQAMYYAIADNPLGPYTYMGKYIDRFAGQSGTNHGSIVQYKGRWLAFYHSAIYSGGRGETRSLMANYLYYNEDGTIKPIMPDSGGITYGVPTRCVIKLEAENGEAAGGRLMGTRVGNTQTGFSGKGYVTGFDHQYKDVEVLAHVAKDMDARLKVRLSSDRDFLADIGVDVTMLNAWDGTPVKKTNGWELVDFGEVRLRAGANKIRFTSHHKDANLKIDYFLLAPADSLNP